MHKELKDLLLNPIQITNQIESLKNEDNTYVDCLEEFLKDYEDIEIERFIKLLTPKFIQKLEIDAENLHLIKKNKRIV